jgi:hypothetical protein
MRVTTQPISQLLYSNIQQTMAQPSAVQFWLNLRRLPKPESHHGTIEGR